ncbi:hypothetical protein T4A_1056, partial [Trichinella pseudospiralis]
LLQKGFVKSHANVAVSTAKLRKGAFADNVSLFGWGKVC